MALILHLVTSHPKGIKIFVAAFCLFRQAGAAGFDREAICQSMIEVLPEDGCVTAVHVYALSKFYDALPVKWQDDVIAMKDTEFAS